VAAGRSAAPRCLIGSANREGVRDRKRPRRSPDWRSLFRLAPAEAAPESTSEVLTGKLPRARKTLPRRGPTGQGSLRANVDATAALPHPALPG